MFTDQEATKERVDAYAGALEHELEGLEFRVAALQDGKHERLTEEQLAARIEGVKNELDRVKKVKPHAQKAK